MIIPDKKKIATLVMARIKPEGGVKDGGEKLPEEGIEPEMEGFMSCAEDLLSAIEQKSTHGVAMALRAFMDLYEQNPHTENEDSEA